MPFEPAPLDHEFTAPIGVDVKGELWACVEMPGSSEFFGTGRAVRGTQRREQPSTTSPGRHFC